MNSRTALDLNDKRVLVLGLGVNQGGIGIARYLCHQGAEVRVTDLQPAERLADALNALDDLPIGHTLGRHDEEDIRWADIVVRNPGVPRDSRWLKLAREHGCRIEMEMTLFFRACPAPIIGITGTKGKTTTSSMLATLLRQTWPDLVLAGNMGRSAIGQLDAIRPDIPVVLELSSFQLEGLDEHGLGPHIAVITNIGEDHLDRYESFDEYAGVKLTIGSHQNPSGWFIFNRDDRVIAGANAKISARLASFGVDPAPGDHVLWIGEERFAGRWDGRAVDLGPASALRLPGEHARLNVLAALTAGLAAGASPESLAAALPLLEPVPDRLEPVATVNGVEYVNDTAATVPAAAIAALDAFADRPLVVIAGGSEKHIRLDSLADAIRKRADHVILLDGAATATLKTLLQARDHPRVDGPYDGMYAAVERAAAVAEPDGVVLLSPGCASFGMFQNEFDRGRQFRAAVERIAGKEV